jgi:hypothetical protein
MDGGSAHPDQLMLFQTSCCKGAKRKGKLTQLTGSKHHRISRSSKLMDMQVWQM